MAVVNTPFDPKLKLAMDEVKLILKKYDIGGSIVLVSPSHVEYLNEVSPSWSCAKFEGKNAIRFRARKSDYNSKEEQHKAIEETSHLLLQVRDNAGRTFVWFDEIAKALQKAVDITHKPFYRPEHDKEVT